MKKLLLVAAVTLILTGCQDKTKNNNAVYDHGCAGSDVCLTESGQRRTV